MIKLIFLSILSLLLVGCGTPSGRGNNVSSRAMESAKIHTELASLYFERSQMGIALNEIELALQGNPDYAPAFNMRGLIHMQLRQDKEAEDDFKQSLRLDGNDSETHNNYGWFLCQHGKEKESISQFMIALKNPLYSTPEIAYLNAGICSRTIGNNKDAEEFLSRALQLRPNLTQALSLMAEITFAKGDYNAAKKQFAKLSENAASLTAEQLFMAVRTERKLGDRNAEAGYASQLRKVFPNSKEAQMLKRRE